MLVLLNSHKPSNSSIAGCAPRADRPLPDREGQPDRAAAPLHLPRPEARVGPLQRVRTHHQGTYKKPQSE